MQHVTGLHEVLCARQHSSRLHGSMRVACSAHACPPVDQLATLLQPCKALSARTA